MIRHLRELGHDVVDLREQGLSRMPDADIMKKAREEDRIILTFDLDFGELLAQAGTSGPSVVLFRLGPIQVSAILNRVVEVLQQEAQALQQGAIVVVEKFRLRVRKLPIDKPAGEPT